MSEEQPDVGAVYQRGTTQFMGLELKIAPGALVPRAETELLGNEAVALLREFHGKTVIDVCCGSGNLGTSIAKLVTDVTVFAADLMPEATAVARSNVEHLGVQDRVRVFTGDLFEPMRASLPADGVDLIVCNPPYISTGKLESERARLLDHEPRAAFDGGPYGLAIHQRVIKEAVDLLKPNGFLLFEFGLGQERQMTALFARSRKYQGLRFVNNSAGAPRVAVAQKT